MNGGRLEVSRVEVVVLGLLAEEPLYGYGVLDRLRAHSIGFWAEVGRASVYQALRRMEAEGLIAGKAQEGTDGPDRRVFRITKTGRERLLAGIAEGAAGLSPYETDAGTAMGFAHLLSAGEARKAVDARELGVRDLLDAIRTERARTSADRGPARTVANGMLDRQEALAKAELAWLGRFRAQLGKLRR
ncbi:MAG: PadR family transcriptional regulator [Actinomycetota bacterium]